MDTSSKIEIPLFLYISLLTIIITWIRFTNPLSHLSLYKVWGFIVRLVIFSAFWYYANKNKQLLNSAGIKSVSFFYTVP